MAAQSSGYQDRRFTALAPAIAPQAKRPRDEVAHTTSQFRSTAGAASQPKDAVKRRRLMLYIASILADDAAQKRSEACRGALNLRLCAEAAKAKAKAKANTKLQVQPQVQAQARAPAQPHTPTGTEESLFPAQPKLQAQAPAQAAVVAPQRVLCAPLPWMPPPHAARAAQRVTGVVVTSGALPRLPAAPLPVAQASIHIMAAHMGYKVMQLDLARAN